MLKANELTGFGAIASPGKVTVTFIDDYPSASDLTTYTFVVDTSTLEAGDHLLVGLGSGDDGQDHYIVGCKIDTNDTDELVTCTVAGTGGTLDYAGSAFFIYEMPAPAATVDVVLTCSEAAHSAFCAAYRVQGLRSTEPYDINFCRGHDGILATTNANCPGGGAIVGTITCSNRDNPITWSGITEDVEVDREPPSGGDYSGAAHDNFASAQNNLTITATMGNTSQEAALSVVGFSPQLIPPWTPAADGLDGTIEQWLRSDLGVTGSAPVTAWADQSGNGRHMTEATNGPALIASQINGHPILRFDGSNDILSRASVVIAQPFSVFLVFKHVANASGVAPWAGNVADDTGPAFRFDSSGNLYVKSNDLLCSQPAPFGIVDYHVAMGYFAGTESTIALNQRRAERNTANLIGSTSSLRLGARNGAGFSRDDIAECLIVSSPTTRDEARIRRYFNQRYVLWNV